MLTSRAPIGKVAIAGKEMCTNQGFKNMICKNEINRVYLYCWLLFNKDYLNSLGVGATFKEISKKIVENIEIPLPPLPLQQKFASIVEQIEKLKEKQKKSREEINIMFDSLMQKAFNGGLIR
ncbi:restriction endonuclease subunit S [Candidatus Pacearchaeota archaeon]|nr:restriction endonuclease subunit S [Candidatus Pacearchaeota archaeon]